MVFQRLTLQTHQRDAMENITPLVEQVVRQSGVRQGLCTVYIPHTTAAVTLNENADPAVPRDILAHLDRLVPWVGPYAHAEGNAAAHIKASLVGHSVTVLIADGRLQLGTWQAIFFCEFDGPRQREAWVQVLPATGGREA